MIPVATVIEEPARGRDVRRLAGAVLTQAIMDLGGNILYQRHEASEWILRGDVGIITFDTCCAHLERDPGRVREKISRAWGLLQNPGQDPAADSAASDSHAW